MEYSKFPLLGFPKESNKPDGDIVYKCWFEGARVFIWKDKNDPVTYGLNLYKPRFTDESQTHVMDRICKEQGPIHVADAFEAQLAIFYLIQKYLPTGVTDDICHADQAKRTHAATQQEIRSLYSDAASGEALV